MAKLYHKDIGIPAQLALPTLAGHTLTYSAHAMAAAWDERMTLASLPFTVPVNYTLVEIEVDQNRISKSVIRFRWTSTDDLVLVVLPDGFVKTLWLNAHSDTHRTLNSSRYARQ